MQLKNKFKKRDYLYGTWVNINNILIPEILAQANFDWICIDLEHSSSDYNDVTSMIISSENSKVPAFIRVQENNESIIKRVLDIGASGIIVPNVMNKEEAKKAVEAIKYHPKGTRGVGLFRAQKYGSNFAKYFKQNNNLTICILQIEHIKAVENFEEILKVNGVDCFFVGPYDLSSSMGIPGQFSNPKFKKVIKYLINLCKINKISIGIHSVSTNHLDAIKYKKMGFNVLALSIDTVMIKDMSIKLLKKTKLG